MERTPTRATGGAMTAAMRAASHAHARKVLRVGVSEGGRMLGERLVTTREPVTLGTSERCTFTLADRAMPAHTVWFETVNGHVRLRFDPRMHGRIGRETVRTLDELVASGEAVRDRDHFTLALDERSRGRVSMGSVTVYFQFVPLPPVQPRPQLPTAIRTRPLREVDRTYSACLAAFAALTFGSLSAFEYTYDPEVADVFEAVEAVRFVRIAPPPAAVAAIEPSHDSQDESHHEATSTVHETIAAEAHAHRVEHTAATPHEDATARAERQAHEAMASAMRATEALSGGATTAQFIALMNAAHGAGNPVDALRNGAVMNSTITSLANMTGVSTARSGPGLVRTGMSANAAPGARAFTHTELVAVNDVQSGTVSTIERHHAPRIVVDEPMVGETGGLDPDAIERGLRGAAGAMRVCYEQAMRGAPELRGRMEITFTIGVSGRVTRAGLRGLESAPEFGECVQRAVRGIVFPPPTGGSVEGTTSVAFAPGG